MTHALVDYTNPQAAKVEESLKPQPVTVLIKTRSTNNFMNSKVAAQLMLQNEDCSRFDVKIYPPNTQVDEEPQVQLIIAWDHGIATHHRPITTTDAEPQEQDTPTIRATRKPHEELQIKTWRYGARP
ncbi:hypothetical protein BHE74_00034360 [Ensete ventricosum]|nr:hypothetical protein BHE74_00034360 [Ensete ventricosum]RZR86526.1 hypothetical protein BHM03_00013747 [Ensete ventricosum]